MAKKLAVFDFDHTIVDGNTDIVARKLLKNDQVPESVRVLHQTHGWTLYMQEIFKLLKKHNISKGTVKNAIILIPAVPSIKKLITTLVTQRNYDAIIISDSNSLFINDWLEANNMKEYFHSVFTNPAKYNKDGLLEIQGFHEQHTCKLSTVNLCKGKIMCDFIKAQKNLGVIYEHVVYVGDGKNDFCPILRLNQNDFACAREGYALVDVLDKNKTEHLYEKVLAQVCVWKTGQDILNFVTTE